MSPIIGLTDRGTPQFPKIGDIRKGAPKTTNAPGRDLDYFRAVFSEGEQDAAAKFFEVYGPEPREINVLLPFREIDRNFEAWQEEYTASALIHRCDGVTCVMWRDDSGQIRHTPKPCPGGCKQTGRLKVIIPELRRLAYVEVHTTSKWDIVELTANLESLAKLTQNGVSGIPLVLKRRPRQVSTPRGGGKRVRQEKWLLSIEAEPRWVDAKLTAMQLEAFPSGAQLPALPAPDDAVLEGDFEEDETGETGEIAGSEWDTETFENAQHQDDVSEFIADMGAPAYEEPTPEPVAPPVAQLSRPYPPAKVKAGIAARVAGASEQLRGAVAQPQQVGLVAGKLSECFAGQDNAAGSALAVASWLLGHDAQMVQAEALAIIAWLIPEASKKDGTFDLHPAAPAEAAAILAEAQRESGQAELEF